MCIIQYAENTFGKMPLEKFLEQFARCKEERLFFHLCLSQIRKQTRRQAKNANAKDMQIFFAKSSSIFFSKLKGGRQRQRRC